MMRILRPPQPATRSPATSSVAVGRCEIDPTGAALHDASGIGGVLFRFRSDGSGGTLGYTARSPESHEQFEEAVEPAT